VPNSKEYQSSRQVHDLIVHGYTTCYCGYSISFRKSFAMLPHFWLYIQIRSDFEVTKDVLAGKGTAFPSIKACSVPLNMKFPIATRGRIL
jgi:hypothetical protein